MTSKRTVKRAPRRARKAVATSAPALIRGDRMLDGASLADADLTELSLSGRSLRAADLSGAVLDGATLLACDLRGANLARAELQEALNFLAPRTQGLAQDGEPQYGTIDGIYGLDALPIRWA